MGGGTCRLAHEEDSPIPVESLPKIQFTLEVLRKKNVVLKDYDANDPAEEAMWEDLRRLASAHSRRQVQSR
ncbi:MAG TPA: hypothetical protein DCX27_14350 [Balneola sp.]|nr:hypothetical protein [Balneola sp.]